MARVKLAEGCSMQTTGEICMMYKEAKNKKEEIRILAEMNETSKEQIMKILLENGEKLPKSNAGRKKVNETKEEEKKEMAAKEQAVIPKVVYDILVEELEKINDDINAVDRKMQELEEEKAELTGKYQQVADYIKS